MTIVNASTIKLGGKLYTPQQVLNVYGYTEHGRYHTCVQTSEPDKSSLVHTVEGDRFDRIDAWWQAGKKAANESK